MTEIIYITDNLSINQMLNIENLMSDNINKVEILNNWIGGEFYIQTCLYLLLEKYFKNKYIHLTLKEDSKYINNVLDESKIIIFPGWIHDIEEDNLQFYKYKNKLYSYTYFEFNFKNIKNLTSHKYNDNVIPLYYYKIPFNIDSENICFNNNIKGLLLGKCISHNIKIYENIINLLNKLNDSNIKLFSTLRNLKNMDIFPKYLENIKEECIIKSDTICNHSVLELLGILNPKKFRKLLIHCKYILCLGNPYYPPTIIESLFSNCIVIAPAEQISKDLHNNKNVYLTDNLSINDIILLINKIENDEITFDINDYPVNYTEESMINVLNNLLK
jgi:hypothetical protein